MMTRLRRITLRDLALFVVIAGVVSASTACGAQDSSPTNGNPAEGEPLALTLTPAAKHYCETDRARESLGVLNRGWVLSEQLALQWRVTGGEPPYALNIEGWRFSRPAGIVWVPCVDTTVSWRWGRFLGEAVRLYESDPQVDSGWKTVRATVIDANGDTAEATARFYVILDLGGGSSGEILTRGKTYRVMGVLMTAPDSYDLIVGGYNEHDCPENDPNPRCGHAVTGFGLVGVDAAISLYEEDGELYRRRPEADGSGGPAGAAGAELTAAVDALVESLGKLPTGEEN